jgi:hypothetical protein
MRSLVLLTGTVASGLVDNGLADQFCVVRLAGPVVRGRVAWYHGWHGLAYRSTDAQVINLVRGSFARVVRLADNVATVASVICTVDV